MLFNVAWLIDVAVSVQAEHEQIISSTSLLVVHSKKKNGAI